MTVLFFTLASFFAGVSTAGAQALSNIGEPTGGSVISISSSGSDVESAVLSFITGASSPSFDLSEVDFLFSSSPNGSPSGLTIGLYGLGFNVVTGTGGFITSLTLTGGDPAVAGVSTFSVSATLAASTTYYLKLAADGTGNTYLLDQPSTTNSTGLPGWAYGDSTVYFNGSVANASAGNFSYAVYATAVPEPATYVVFAGAAALGLALWRRAGRRVA